VKGRFGWVEYLMLLTYAVVLAAMFVVGVWGPKI
jgi:hypothetical protein